jgi:hypothetical protein
MATEKIAINKPSVQLAIAQRSTVGEMLMEIAIKNPIQGAPLRLDR